MHNLHELHTKFPIRRKDAQKEAFRQYVVECATTRGLTASVQTTSDGKNKNVVVGNPETASVVFTAHYDTPARALVPNLMFPNSWIYLLYQCLIIGTLLVVSFIPAWLIGMTMFHSTALYVALYYVFYYTGTSNMPASQAFIVNYLWPIMSVVFACIILKEKMTVPKIFALFVFGLSYMELVSGGFNPFIYFQF